MNSSRYFCLATLLTLTLAGLALSGAKADPPNATVAVASSAPKTARTAAAESRIGVRVPGAMAVTMTVQTFKAVHLSELAGPKATVLVFLGTQCPISNGYAPDVAAMAKAYREKGVRFVYVYPNAGETQADSQKHVSAKFGTPGVWDVRQRLADAVGATATPEVAVLDGSLTLRYRGRIDDRYPSRGVLKPVGAKTAELKEAVDAVLAGKPIRNPETRPTGCLIERGENPTPASSATDAKPAPNFAEDIAPIIQQNCQSCHRSGEIGPMPFETYEQVRKYAANIAAVTESKFMPPWKPIEGHGDFKNKRTLTDEQIATLKRWADAGAPMGDPTKTPKVPEFPKGWQLGTPDLVLSMPEKWHVEATGRDVYRCFVLPTGLTEDKDVVAVEYRAGNKRVVHHVIGYVDVAGEAKKKDEKDPGPGYTSFGGPGFLPFGEMGGWAPGNMPSYLPDGIGRKLPAGSDVVIQVHYHPDGQTEEDITQVGIYFARKPVQKQLRIVPVVVRKLEIPANEANYWVEATFPVPLDANVIFVAPHMHLLGREMEMWATLPDGTVKPIIKINDWDFRWQDTYTYKEPLHLPKGAKVTLKARYDNSTGNPKNPNSPPKTVTWGEETTDEMCIGFLGFYADDDNDPVIRLFEGMRQKRKASNDSSDGATRPTHPLLDALRRRRQASAP